LVVLSLVELAAGFGGVAGLAAGVGATTLLTAGLEPVLVITFLLILIFFISQP